MSPASTISSLTPTSASSSSDPRGPVSFSDASHPSLPFHRLAHLEPRTARWWRPLLVVVLAAALVVILFVALAIATGVITWLIPSLRNDPQLEDMTNPATVAFMLGMIVILLPAVVLATRWAGGRPGTAHSVTGRFRWGLLGRAAVVVVPLYAVVNGAITWATSGAPSLAAPVDATLLAALLVMVVLVPLQAAGEEYAFRVLPQQVLGTWLRSPLWGILLPVPLFALAHGYDAWGQAAMGVFALCTGVLVWKTGGVELAILVHAANNLTVFLLTPFYPVMPIGEGAVAPGLAIADMVFTIALTAVLCVWFSRREGLALREPAKGRGRVRAEG